MKVEIHKDMATGDLLELSEQVAKVIREGGLAVVPTETVYGIATDIRCPQICQMIYQIKNRDPKKPFSWHIGELEQINFPIDKAIFQQLAQKFWPGPLTMVVPHPTDGTVGLRYPDHEVFHAISYAVGAPMLATSANISSEASPARIEDISEQVLKHVDVVVDAGPCDVGQDSTVIDVCGANIQMLREGSLSFKDLIQALA